MVVFNNKQVVGKLSSVARRLIGFIFVHDNLGIVILFYHDKPSYHDNVLNYIIYHGSLAWQVVLM
jgi:hypothetical protein